MNYNMVRWLSIGWLAGSSVWAGVPLPAVTYYGCVRNAYGYPYAKDAEVVFNKGSNECVRYRINGERRRKVWRCRLPIPPQREITAASTSIVIQIRYVRREGSSRTGGRRSS